MYYSNINNVSAHNGNSWNSESKIFQNLLDENQEWGSRVLDRASVLTPPLDIVETEKTFVVTMDIPGIHSDDIVVETTPYSVQVIAEKREASRDGLRRVERGHGVYSRTLTLPTEVLDSEAQSRYEDGVLTIQLPKKSTASIRSITIEVIN